MVSMQPEISIVVPFYNEGANVRPLFARLVPVLESLGPAWEIVCVNDGSRDDTLLHLIDMTRRYPSVKVIDLSRNFGKEAALTAGIAQASGNAVVPMDGDLQHPPELIPELVAKWRSGFEMVSAVRRSRADQSAASRLFAKTFYWVFKRLAKIELPEGAGDFRLLDRKIVDILNQMPERNRFMKGLFAWVGFRHATVPFDVAERAAGRSKWGFWRLLRFAFAGITAFSNFPLKIWGLVGAVISGCAFFYIVIRLLRTAIYGVDVPGYESMIITILFLGGVQLLTLGIIGDYLGRMFDEVKGRPLYVVRATYGMAQGIDGTAARPDENRPPPLTVVAGS